MLQFLPPFLFSPETGGGGGENDPGTEVWDEGEEVKDSDKRMFSQGRLNSHFAKNRREATAAGERSVLEKLGFKNAEEAETEVTRLKKIETDQMSDLEKREQETKAKEDAAQKTTENSRAALLTTRVERALERAGVPVEQSEDVRKMVTVADNISDEDLKTTVEQMRGKHPSLFAGASKEEQENKEEEGGAPKGGDPGKKPPTGGKVTDKKAEAGRLLKERHPEIAQRREAEAQASVTT